MIHEHKIFRPDTRPAEPTEREIIDKVAGLISSWFVRKDQKYFDIDLPPTPMSKSDIERVSLIRLHQRFGSNYLTREVLNRAFRKAIDERHTEHLLSILVWSGEQVCRPGNTDRVVWASGYVHLNTWRSPAFRRLVPDVEPDYGVAGEFIAWLFPRSKERAIFLDWLAWSLQHESDKPMWAPEAAKRLCDTYAANRPLAKTFLLAFEIMEARWTGTGKDQTPEEVAQAAEADFAALISGEAA